MSGMPIYPSRPSPLAALAGALFCLLLLAAPSASAHESRPAYLQLTETAAQEFDVLFKTPRRGELSLALEPRLSGNIEVIVPPVARATEGASVETWRIRARDPLAGRSLAIEGLENTLTDTLLRIEYADGSSWTHLLSPAAPEVTLPERPSGWDVAGTYLPSGIEHILLGWDHLLFVLGLVLLASGWRKLVGAITAFTAAHSITLAAATLGWAQIPSKPLEAAIALSIAFVAVEVIYAKRGRITFATRRPWTIAFAFGLLHGFGFAGVLNEVGLPAGQIPAALLFFNIGVEIGQLLFVAAVLALGAALKTASPRSPRWANSIPAYLVGSMAMFWVFERVATF